MNTTKTPHRGAIATPRSRLAAATPFHAPSARPPAHLVIPAVSAWGNLDHGDSVVAEEAFAKACASPAVVVPDREVIAWAKQHGALEGAVISHTLDAMRLDGLRVGASSYFNGERLSVDWTDPATLQGALLKGPVKLGVAGDQLERAWRSTGGQSGWFATGLRDDAREDHCAGLCGYGPIAWLADRLNARVPEGVDGARRGYVIFSWGSLGIIDGPSLVAITHEAWLRHPTTIRLDDVMPREPVAQGRWPDVGAERALTVMHDGRVLERVPERGLWRLWDYDPEAPGELLSGEPVAQGRWRAIGRRHALVVMRDGRVLDWNPSTGAWRLWDYTPTRGDGVLARAPVAQGRWTTIRRGHELRVMPDGRVLDWVPADGSWRLWDYDASCLDVLRDDPVAEGRWSSICAGHTLEVMRDGRVLDCDHALDTWRLWNYDPDRRDDVFPGEAVAEGQWRASRAGRAMTTMPDGRVLDWHPVDGTWQLREYSVELP